MNSVKKLKTVNKNLRSIVDAALDDSGGLLRLAPCWVPRSFLQPGKRLKLHPDDLYAYGLNRGGIDERWFASTTPCANENRTPDEGLSYIIAGKQRFTLQQAVAECGATLTGKKICDRQQQRENTSSRKTSPSLTTSRGSTTTSGTTSLTRSWVSNPAPRKRKSAA